MFHRRGGLTVLIALCAFASPSRPVGAQTAPTRGVDVLERMHAAYDGHWFHTLTFSQKTTQPRADGTETVATWYESLRYTPASGTQLRIDIGPLSAGNGVLYTADSSWTVRAGKPAAGRAVGNEFLPLIEGVYVQPVARTLAELASTGVDLARVASGRWHDRAVWIIGVSSSADTTSPQIWVDVERNILVRMIVRSSPSATPMDVHLDDLVQLGGGWLATKVAMSVGGAPRQTEEYAGWKADVELPAALFDITQWMTAPHWAGR